MIRSLAVPVSLLRDAGQHTPRGRGLIIKEFHDAVKFLLSLDASIDQDLDFIKYFVSNWFQGGVGDIRADTGHKCPEPSPSVAVALQKRPHLFRGYLKRLVDRNIHRSKQGNKKAISIGASFLLLKRGWPELSETKRLESLIDHQKYLSQPLPSISEELVEAIKATTRKVLGKKPIPNLYTKLSPSHNASFSNSRKKGGAYEEVVEHHYAAPRARPPPSLGARNAGKPVRASLRAFASSVGVWKTEVLVNTRALRSERLEKSKLLYEQRKQLKIREEGLQTIDEEMLFSSPGERPQPSAELHEFIYLAEDQSTYDLLLEAFAEEIDDAYREANSVRVQVIPEPGKFRIITAGRAELYTYLQGLQGVLMQRWKMQSVSTMRAGWEEEVESWVAPEGWLWNSGDYKAATDQLNGSSSHACEAEIKKVVGLPNLETGLLNAQIEYNAKDTAPGMSSSVFQRNGQLMGHPLSFFVLCVINLAGLLRAIQIGITLNIITKAEGRIVLRLCKINGDDILFPCPPLFVAVWERTAAELGLKLSIGKSYSSSFFAMVNNVMFKMGRRGGRRIGYVNQKLIFNYSLKSGDELKSPLEIGHAFNNMFNYCEVARPFLSDAIANRNLEKTYGYNPNFFVNTKLGGLGVNPKYAKGSIRLTSTQRRVAALFTEDVLNSFLWSNGINTKGPLQKLIKELPAPRLTTAANAEKYEMRLTPSIKGQVVDFVTTDPEEEPLLFTSNDSTYSAWVALLTSMTSSIEEKSSRKLNLAKILKVKPMKRDKVLKLQPMWMFPELPEPRTGFAYSYPVDSL